MSKSLLSTISILLLSNNVLAEQVNHISNSSISSAISASVNLYQQSHPSQSTPAVPYSSSEQLNSSLFRSALAIQESHTKFMKQTITSSDKQSHSKRTRQSPSFFNRVLETNGN